MLDPHQRPPESLRAVYKRYQRLSIEALADDLDIVDFSRGLSVVQQKCFRTTEWSTSERLRKDFGVFMDMPKDPDARSQVQAYHHIDLPDLTIIPQLIPVSVQRLLLSKLLHRDLALPEHKTNISLHYDISYTEDRSSLFSNSPPSTIVTPRDPSVHKSMTTGQLLNKKLRWMTLGGQYDWTSKLYPDETPPPFPADLSTLLKGLFPDTDPQAAIVNLYSPGDTLSLHRDVSEVSDRGLVSLSIGCDAIFVIGSNEDSSRYTALRIRSGDLVYMAGPARFAWHGVPMIVSDTCPSELKAWPAEYGQDHPNGAYENWRDWMATKRINLNVRQMA